MPLPNEPRRWSVRALLVPALLVAALACSSVKEWEPVAGRIALYAEPLTPRVDEPLQLGIEAHNVGPIDVYQGEQRIASLANVDLDAGRIDLLVVARSTELPRAVTTAYDFRRIEVQATAFPTPPAAFDAAAPEDDAGAPVESCPGLVEPNTSPCSTPSGNASVAVRLHNRLDGSISVYELQPGTVDPAQCAPSLLALVAAGETRSFDAPSGAVLRVIEDRSVNVVRQLQLPSTPAPCALTIGGP